MIFLTNIDLKKNQLQNAVIQPLGTPPLTPVEGQIYYNSTTDLKLIYVYNGTNWVPVGDITKISTTESRLIITNGTTGDVTMSLDIATVVANGGTGLVTADLLFDYIEALDNVRSITQGVGISVTGTAANPIISNSDLGSSQNIFKNIAVAGQSNIIADSNNDTLTFVSGSNVTITTNATTDTITIASTDTNTTYDLTNTLVSGGSALNLIGANATTDSVSIVGTTNEIEVTHAAGVITIGIPNNLVVTGNLQVIGTTTTNNVEIVSTANGVVFEGNVADENEITLLATTVTADRTIILPDASGTVALTSSIGNGALNVSAGTALTGGGSFTANQAGNTTVTINHATIARTNPTNNVSPSAGGTFTAIDSITTTPEGHITAVNTKTVTLPAVVVSSYATTITGTSTITHGLSTRDVIVQLFDIVTNETVYADVVRTSTGTVTVSFGNTPTNSIRVLVNKIG
jgi:hypothetical protein